MSVDPDDWRNIYGPILESAMDEDDDERVWYLLEEALGPDLVYRPVRRRDREHGFIEPAREMSLDEYESALAATRDLWRVELIELEEKM